MNIFVGMLVGWVALGAVGCSLAEGDAEAGKAKSVLCMSCHGPRGISAVPIYPNLAGQEEQDLVSALKAYRAGERKGGRSALMTPMAKPLSDADIDNLAAYYSSLKP